MALTKVLRIPIPRDNDFSCKGHVVNKYCGTGKLSDPFPSQDRLQYKKITESKRYFYEVHKIVGCNF